MPELTRITADASYVDIDIGELGTTTLFDPEEDSYVYGVFLLNDTSAARATLEVTNGSQTGVLRESGAGGSIDFQNTFVLGHNDTLQLTVTQTDGAETNTATILKAER